MDFDLPEDMRALQDSVASFCARVIFS